MGYAVLSILYFGVRVLVHRGGIVGVGSDPDLFTWMVGWWPHAILHGHNPFTAHVVWSPSGVNLAWATSVPGLALPVAPITLLLGPAAAHNVLALALPPLAAWTAYLLCRHLTGALWPSLAGGYLFGFSSYMLGQEQGHLHMIAVFLLPVVALLVVRYLEGSIGRLWFVVLLGIAVGWQLWISTEVAFTMTLALGLSLATAFLLVPEMRARLRVLLAPLASAYLLAAVLAAPLLLYVAIRREPVGNNPAWFPGDLVNIFSPTRLTWLNTSWSERTASHFHSWSAESGLYLGLPLLLIVVWFGWSRRRNPGSRFLIAVLALALFCALGTELDIGGKRYAWLPYNAISHLPLFKNVLPVRFSLYSALAASVIAALWAASPSISRRARTILLLAAVAAIVPNVTLAGSWYAHPSRPSFFASGTYKRCLTATDNVLMLPIPAQSDAMLWQAEADYSFKMADGYITAVPPLEIPYWSTMVDFFVGAPLPSVQDLTSWVQADGVTVILVDAPYEPQWKKSLAGFGRPQEIGGVYLYRLEPQGSPPCANVARASAAPSG